MPVRPLVRVATMLAPAVLLLPTSAQAEKVVTYDEAEDAQLVTSFVPAEGPPVVTSEPAPDETAVDITRTVAAHGDARLSITVHLRDLVLSSVHDTYVRLETPQGRQYAVLVGKNPGFRAKALLLRRGLETDCRSVRAVVDGGADTVAISLPTACVDAPRWVRVAVGVTRVAEVAEPYAYPMGAAQLADSLGFGPKVHRG